MAIDLTKLTDERKKAVAASLARGSTVTNAAKAAGVSRGTVYAWMHDDPKFAKRIAKEQAEQVQIIWGECFRLAQTEEYTETKRFVDGEGKKRIETVTKIRWASVAAIDQFLRNNDKRYIQRIQPADAGLTGEELAAALAGAINDLSQTQDMPPPEELEQEDGE